MLKITKERSGDEIEIHAGESFEILLPENPTTGFRWQAHSPPGLTIEQENDSFDRQGAALGAGGHRRWTFRGVKTGTATIELEYRRSWEDRVVDSFKLKVKVSPAKHEKAG